MYDMKPFYKSKTILFNALWAAVLAFCGYNGIEIPDNIMEIILLIGNVGLRFITNSPINIKEPKEKRFVVDPETGYIKLKKFNNHE